MRPLCTVLGCRRLAGRVIRGAVRQTRDAHAELCAEHRRPLSAVGNSRRYNAEAKAAVALLREYGPAEQIRLARAVLDCFENDAAARAFVASYDPEAVFPAAVDALRAEEAARLGLELLARFAHDEEAREWMATRDGIVDAAEEAHPPTPGLPAVDSWAAAIRARRAAM